MSERDKRNSELKQLLLNESCLDKLGPFINDVNVFDILGVGRNENRHSNLLAWLLNANASHNLGDSFVREFVRRVIERNPDKPYDVIEWAGIDYYSGEIKREETTAKGQKGKKGRLDIFLKYENNSDNGKSHLIIIENKIDAKESTGQTPDYRQGVLEKYSKDKYNTMFVFLTAQEEDPEDVETWSTLSYADVLDVIMKLEHCRRWEMARDKTKKIIEDYCEVIKRFNNDDDLIQICNEIYKRHRKAIDFIEQSIKTGKDSDDLEPYRDLYNRRRQELDKILENRDNPNRIVAEALREKLPNSEVYPGTIRSAEGQKGTSYVRFTSDFMNSIIPRNNEANSSWRTQDTDYYEFDLRDLKTKNKIGLALILAGDNVDEETKKKHRIVAKILVKPEKLRSAYRWWNIQSCKKIVVDLDNINDEIDKIVNTSIEWIVKTEDKIKKQIK